METWKIWIDELKKEMKYKGRAPDEILCFEEDWLIFFRQLEMLPYREREVIVLKHGLLTSHCYTLDDIARIFGVTRSRIGQLYSQASFKLNRWRRKNETEVYFDNLLLSFRAIGLQIRRRRSLKSQELTKIAAEASELATNLRRIERDAVYAGRNFYVHLLETARLAKEFNQYVQGLIYRKNYNSGG